MSKSINYRLLSIRELDRLVGDEDDDIATMALEEIDYRLSLLDNRVAQAMGENPSDKPS